MAEAKRGRKRTRSDLNAEENELFEKIRLALQPQAAKSTLIFSTDVAMSIARRAREAFMSEPALVPVDAPVNICGDIHGQLHDLISIFTYGGLPPDTRYLFLGDYVDRGKYGVECICILFGLKLLFPDSIFLLRGNHESTVLTRQYGFFDECKRKYTPQLYKAFTDTFAVLPIAAIVESAALCMHGGLSPELNSLEQIEKIARPVEPGNTGLLVDLLWADPSNEIDKWQMSDRGVSFVFGPAIVHEKLQKLDIDLVVRAHQVVERGYQFFAGRQLVTVFSATNYCGEFTNSGAMLMMDKDLQCKFHLFTPNFEAIALNANSDSTTKIPLPMPF